MKILVRIEREYWIARASIILKLRGINHGKRPFIFGQAPLFTNRGSISIGDRVILMGEESRTALRTDAEGQLIVGNGVLINSGAFIHASQYVKIGDNCKIASHVSISDTDSHEVSPGAGIRRKPVQIEANVWIGRAAIVLPGVRIGEGAVIGAGSIVTRDVESFTVVAGNPARPIRTFSSTSTVRK